nr:chorismate-binding protein [Cellulomonas sp. APG4]
MSGPVGGSRDTDGWAWFDGVRARGAVECVDLATRGDRVASGGWWAVVGDFEGRVRAWRFAEVDRAPGVDPPVGGPWHGPASAWRTSIGERAYRTAVEAVRGAVREGDVYQVNLCRVLEADLPEADADAAALLARLRAGNPAPYGGGVHVPAQQGDAGAWVVTASPELFWRVRDGWVESGPIKGTAAEPAGLTAKDRAENVMIADMVRNDLQRVCDPGTVEVTRLLDLEQHPGLVHLVTTVRGRLRSPAPSWGDVLAATYPPASVSGAPKHAALGLIRALEPVPRGPYCGAVGWVDADAGRAELAVGIRTFWWEAGPAGRGTLRFGTGAGITWGSDARAEWAETELKAARLIGLAGTGPR